MGRSSLQVVPTGPVPASPTRRSTSRMPVSVRYAQSLLRLQGGIWACGAVLWAGWAVTAGVKALAGDADLLRRGGVLFFLVAAMTSGFAVSKFRLARSIAGRRERARKVVIGVEFVMAGLGTLITVGTNLSGGVPAGLVLFPAFVGGGLSLAAALGLLRRPARQFFAEPGPVAGPTPGGDSGAAFTVAGGIVRRNAVPRPA